MPALEALLKSSVVRPGWEMRKYFDWAQSATESRRAEVALSAVLRTALWRPASFDLGGLLDVFCASLSLLAMFGWRMPTLGSRA